jgi:uncharacterized protein YjbJ (UPF0337 family)
MDQDRIEGSARTMMGRIKSFFGSLMGDSKMKTEGKLDQTAGRMQNTAGGVKDAMRGDDSDRR